jgi:MFS family permease
VHFIPALGVFSGWIIVMPATVLTLAARVDEIDSGTGDTKYSLALSAGWISLIVALFLMGRIGDAYRAKYGTRSAVIGFGILGAAIFGYALGQANAITSLALIWCLIQFPAAAIITSSLAMASQNAKESKQGLSSGLAGGAPVFALFVGTLVTSAATLTPANAFVVTSLLGALLAIPLLMIKKSSVDSTSVNSASDKKFWDTADSQKFWNRFLLSAFLLSCATSSANGFLLVFASQALGLEAEPATNLVTTMVLAATLSSIISGVITGKFLSSKTQVTYAYSIAAIVVGLSIGILAIYPSQGLALIVGLVFGVGFGSANGLELTIFIRNQRDQLNAGKSLGLFTGVTTAPFVLVPLIAAYLLKDDGSTGITQLWLGGSVFGIIAGILVLRSSKVKA